MWGGQAKEREGSPEGGRQPCVFSVIYGGAILCSFTMPQASEMRGWASMAQSWRNKKKVVWRGTAKEFKAHGNSSTFQRTTLDSQAARLYTMLEGSCKLQSAAVFSILLKQADVELWHKLKCLISYFLCWFQTVQQNLPGQWQLWPDVLRPRLQPVHREAGGALPLQVPLVLLRHLQEVRADRGAIRLQMRTILVPSHPRLQINQSTTIPRRLTFVLSFSMCISRRNGLFLCQYNFFIKSPNCQLGFWAFFHFTNLDVESVATAPVYVKTAVLLGISFCLLMIINPLNRDIESLFYYSSSQKK